MTPHRPDDPSHADDSAAGIESTEQERASSSSRLDALLAYAPWVRRLARGLLFDRSLAEDVAQDVWVAALRHPPRRPEAAASWMGKVTRSLVFRANRRESREDEALRRAREERPGSSPPSGEDIAVRMEAHRQLLEAVLALPEPYRTVIHLRYFDELEIDVIAARLESPASTIRTQLSRGLARLRDRLTSDATSRGTGSGWCALVLPLLDHAEHEELATSLSARFAPDTPTAEGHSNARTIEVGDRSSLATGAAPAHFSRRTLTRAALAALVLASVVLWILWPVDRDSTTHSTTTNEREASTAAVDPVHRSTGTPELARIHASQASVPVFSSDTALESELAIHVVDARTGDAIADAEVRAARVTLPRGAPIGRTDAQGRLVGSAARLRRDELIVRAVGHVVHREPAALRASEDFPLEIALEPAFLSTIEVLDPEGLPVEGVAVEIESESPPPPEDASRGIERTQRRFQTDASGRVEYAFDDPRTTLRIAHERFAEVHRIASAPHTQVRLAEGRECRVRVVSDELPLADCVVEVERSGLAPRRVRTDEDGRASLGFQTPDAEIVLTLRHADRPGYRVRGQPPAEGAVDDEWTIDVPLGAYLSGRAIDELGAPAAGGLAFVLTHHDTLDEAGVVASVRPTSEAPKRGRARHRLVTLLRSPIEADGRFQIGPIVFDGRPLYLWIHDESRVNRLERLTRESLDSEKDRVLEIGTSIRGRVIDPSGAPLPGVMLHFGELWSEPSLAPGDEPSLESIAGRVRSDASGHFELIGVPASVDQALAGQTALRRSGLFCAAFAPDQLIALDGLALTESGVWKGFRVEPGRDIELLAASRDGGVTLGLRLRDLDTGLPVSVPCPAYLVVAADRVFTGAVRELAGALVFHIAGESPDASLEGAHLLLCPEGYEWIEARLSSRDEGGWIEARVAPRPAGSRLVRLEDESGMPLTDLAIYVGWPRGEPTVFVPLGRAIDGRLDVSCLPAGTDRLWIADATPGEAPIRVSETAAWRPVDLLPGAAAALARKPPRRAAGS